MSESLIERERRIRENDGRVNLSTGNRRVLPEQRGLLRFVDEPVAVPFVKSNGPFGVRPRADESPARRETSKMLEQLTADPSPLALRQHIRVPDEGDVLYGL